MKGSVSEISSSAKPPKALERSRRLNASLVWVVPLVTALVAGYLVYQRAQEYGPTITITFKDGSGLRAGYTPIKYRGVAVGQVIKIGLSKDHQHVVATAHLKRSDAELVQEGTDFWIVRPEVELGSVTGLSTVMTGPEIQMLPGNGKRRADFEGLESAPPGQGRKGLEVILHCARLGFLRPNSPVSYRGVEVGVVESAQLGSDATTADVKVFIQQRYAHLVRDGSRFWRVGGAQISGGLFQGVKVKVDSLSSLAEGGITFATPDDPNGRVAKSGAEFALYDDASKEWLDWAPRIPLPNEQ
ncbi:MAG TPA: MlaD family protein [Steroidobacteraceae bacterium]